MTEPLHTFDHLEDEESDADESFPPITERDIRMIVAVLHDEGRGHVIPDMIESITGERPPDGIYTPKRMPIRDPQWREARKKIELKRARIARKARMTPEKKAKRIKALKNWETANPDKMKAAVNRRLENKKTGRKTRPFVAVDLEGFDTGRYFTDDRRDYAREHHENMARGTTTLESTEEFLTHVLVREEDRWNPPFAGWTAHDRQWYLDQHELTEDDPEPSAHNKRPGTPPIYIEHRPFLFGAGNDHDQYFLTAPEAEADGVEKIRLNAEAILNAIVDLPKRFGDAIFITFAIGYDVAQILRCLDATTAANLQAGEIVTDKVDEDGAPYEETVEQKVFFWKEFAISYRRGKMFAVGRLNDPAKPHKFEEITDPVRRQAYIDAGREPVTRTIDYKDKAVVLNDCFGFFQKSFIEAYEGSGIPFTLEEMKIIVEGKRKRRIMASLPMKEVRLYQEMELRILCRMMNKLRETTNALELDLPHWQGAGSISMAMSNKHRARDFYPKIRADNWSPEQEWAHYSFAGGNIQMVMQGRHTGGIEVNEYGPPRPLFGYDITSAYPSIQYQLPAQALPIEWKLQKNGRLGNVTRRIEGKWVWREGGELTEDIIRTMSIYSMIEVDFSFPEKCFDAKLGELANSRGFSPGGGEKIPEDGRRGKLRPTPYYPLFYRRDDGSILFPARGRGRYYRDELLAAFEWVRRMRPDMNEVQHSRMIKLRGAYEFICPTIHDLTPDQLEAIKTNCPSARIGDDGLIYPFDYVKEYYDQRALYPKTDSRNGILKLGVNGAWGKTAQSVGGRNGMPPASASPWYAGVVTAGTRAKCMQAALNAPWSVIHFATDGIQSNAPLNIENKDKLLGKWEMATFTRGVYVKPGIYAFANDFMRQEAAGSSLDEFVADHVFKGKSRGVSLRSILGEDGEDDADKKRDIQSEWFDYLDQLALDSYDAGRSLAILPHKKLMTFGGSASCAERWPMCGNWVEDNRIFKMNAAGVKREACQDRDRAYDLVVTKVAENKTPKILSARHNPEWLAKEAAIILDLHENQDLALAHGWECSWDVGEDE